MSPSCLQPCAILVLVMRSLSAPAGAFSKLVSLTLASLSLVSSVCRLHRHQAASGLCHNNAAGESAAQDGAPAGAFAKSPSLWPT